MYAGSEGAGVVGSQMLRGIFNRNYENTMETIASSYLLKNQLVFS